MSRPRFSPRIQLSRPPDQHLGKVAVDSPVARLVGIGQCGSGNGLSEAQPITTFGACIQTHLNVAQTFPGGKLHKGQAQELFAAREVPDFIVALIAVDAAREQLAMDQLNELGENESSNICHPKVEPCPAKPASLTRYPSPPSSLVSSTSIVTNQSTLLPQPDTSECG